MVSQVAVDGSGKIVNWKTAMEEPKGFNFCHTCRVEHRNPNNNRSIHI